MKPTNKLSLKFEDSSESSSHDDIIIKYKIYSLPKYAMKKSIFQDFLSTCFIEHDIASLVKCLETSNNSYHMRIYDNGTYTFFGDLDEYPHDISIFLNDMLTFLSKYLSIKLNLSDIKYTINYSKSGSYHYSIPKLYCSCSKLKEVHQIFKNEYDPNYKYTKNKKIMDCIDTTIYSNKWFRLPLQSKESVSGTEHKIINGKMEDFILEYIPESSFNIENIIFKTIKKTTKPDPEYLFVDEPQKKKIPSAKPKKNNDNKVIMEVEVEYNNKHYTVERITNELSTLKHGTNYLLYKELFDKCYSQNRFETYEYWINIGMAIKNIYDMDGFTLFDYYSSKSEKYAGKDQTLQKYNSFKNNFNKGFTASLIYYYAKEDNPSSYATIMYKQDVTFSEVEFAKKLYELASDIFIYQKNELTTNLKLYCYNGNYWVPNSLLLEKYIAFELFGYYDNLYKISYKCHPSFKAIRRKIDSLQHKNTIDHVVHQYKYFGVKDISFDSKWWLFGFSNMVLDLKTHTFRDYAPDDYVSITTGYDWYAPNIEQVNTVEDIIKKIMPHEDERVLYKEILATGIQGSCIEKMCIFSGFGRNGKGLTNEFMLHALGDYGIQANNSILFEAAKTGANPELANLDKKRFVVFKEPSSKKKFENSVIKELTGGGKISARSHYESTTQKTLHNTTVCECNTKPNLAEEPQLADIARIIDLPFRSTFVSDVNEIDEANNIYPIDLNLKSLEFRDAHKCALIQILVDAHTVFTNNNFDFQIPESVKLRTNEYLEGSCNILGWFKENYTLVDKTGANAVVTVKSIHEKFKDSEYYMTLSKLEMRKYTYSYFMKYFAENMITKRYYMDRYDRIINGERIRYNNVITGFSVNEESETT